MSYGSLIAYECQKIWRTVLSTTVTELYSFMKWFGSCQFLRGLWMDISGEVADFHMRTDVENMVTTERTIHLPWQKETIHMISMLRKEACSGSIHSWSCSHFNSELLLSTLSDKGISEGRQFVYCSEFWELDKGRTSQPQNTHGTQGFLINMMHDVSVHKREGCSLLECFKGICCTNSPWRNIPRDVCVKTTYSRIKTTTDVRLESFVIECWCDS